MAVIGIEVNQAWWESRYSNPQFITLSYADSFHPPNIPSDYALLFCYFNNEQAFVEYVANYDGNIIIIIGPGEGRGTHTNPTPFNPNFGCEQFELLTSQEVKDTKDFIAIYERKNT